MHPLRFRLVVLGLLLSFALATASLTHATTNIASTSGSVRVLASAPASALPCDLEDADISVFEEHASLALGADLGVDITVPGAYDSPGGLTPGNIPSGTKVASYYLHYDPPSPSGGTGTSGSVTFMNDVLGVIVLPATLGATDPVVGAPGTTYYGGVGIGLELSTSASQDKITLSPDLKTITIDRLGVNSGTCGGVDELRVITRETLVPVSSSPWGAVKQLYR